MHDFALKLCRLVAHRAREQSLKFRQSGLHRMQSQMLVPPVLTIRSICPDPRLERKTESARLSRRVVDAVSSGGVTLRGSIDAISFPSGFGQLAQAPRTRA